MVCGCTQDPAPPAPDTLEAEIKAGLSQGCLLYTSDAADE